MTPNYPRMISTNVEIFGAGEDSRKARKRGLKLPRGAVPTTSSFFLDRRSRRKIHFLVERQEARIRT